MNPKISRRKPIEIYFILYLAALMLLIPDLKHKDKTIKSEGEFLENDFRIYPEKNILTTKISFDSTGNPIIQSDSVNYIYYSGNVDNVSFEFQVVNKQLNQYITISSNDNSFNFFRYYQLPEIKAAIFVWRPPIIDRRNYVLDVKVNAIANLKDQKNGTINAIKSSTQFSLVVSYVDNQTGLPFAIASLDSLGNGRKDTVFQQNLFGSSELLVDFQNRKLENLIIDEWENKVFVYGVNLLNDLKGKPEVWIINKPENNGGSVYIKQITANTITLGGKTPQFGNCRVRIRLSRRSDGSKIEDEFILEPLPISEPVFSQVMYPNQQYVINPNFPNINKNFAVRLFTENRTLYSANSNSSFTITLDDGLINKSIYLERYINGNLYGRTYQISVKPYPIPIITKVQSIGTDKVRVVVNSFGIFGGKDNYIKSVDLEGNGVYKELVGQTITNRKELTYTQVYEISPQNDNKPFEFKIRFQDNRGAWSNWEKYPN